jgi:hypothetical protein
MSEGKAAFFPNLNTRRRQVGSFKLRPFYLHYTLDMRLDGFKAGLDAVAKRKII